VKTKVCFILFFACILVPAWAQTSASDIFTYFRSPGKPGKLIIIQDAAIQARVNVYVSQQAKLNGIRGFRISIYFGSGQDSKKTAELTRANFVTRYPGVNCHTKFEYPYFKVYVGDFRTRSEALKFLKEIEYNYPDAFIREDIVEFPK
jgi:SPOR domain